MKIAIAARDIADTGGGMVALQTANCLANGGHDVVIVTDVDLPAHFGHLTSHRTPFGHALKIWRPQNKVLKRTRHLLQIILFSLFGRLKLSHFENQGYTSIDHNCEAWGGHVVVFHNVFSVQWRADRRPFLRRLPQFVNPVTTLRIVREWFVVRRRNTLAIVSVGQDNAKEAKSIAPANSTVTVINNGVDLDRFTPLSDEERTQRRHNEGIAGKLLVLFVGHEFERKRLDLAIKALALLPANVVLWVIGGRGSNIGTYRNLSVMESVGDRVHFLGDISRPEYYFQIADVFVLPSEYEAFQLVALEALASGVPTVMTPVGCAKLVTEQGRSGFLVDFSPNSIADAITNITRDSSNWIKMSQTARNIAERYSWKVVAAKYAEVVQQARRGLV